MPRRTVNLFLIAAIGLVAAGAAPTVTQAQTGNGNWTTFASGDEVFALATDPFGDGRELWVGTEGGGVVVWDLSTGDYRQYLFPQEPGLPSNDVRDIAFGPDGDVWLATPKGAVHVDGGTWETYDTSDGLPSDEVTAVAVAADGTVWVGTFDAGLASLVGGVGGWVRYNPDEYIPGDDDTLKDGPGARRVADIAVGDDGRVWVAHGREDATKPALSVYDPLDDGWYHLSPVTPGASDENGPANDQVLSLAFDADGVLWMGTWGRGVQAYNAADDTWTRYTEALDGTCGDNIWSVATGDGQVWAACANEPTPAGVSWWDGDAWTTLRVEDESGDATGLPTDVVRAVLVLDGGDVYLGTNGPGLVGSGVVPVIDGLVEDALTTAPGSPAWNDVTALLVDPDTGDLWAGTYARGLMRYDGTRWDSYTMESTVDDLAGDTVSDLALRDRELWIASPQMAYDDQGRHVDGGVSALALDTGDWRLPLTKYNSDLPDGDVSSLAVDDDGLLWIGIGVATYGVGDGYDVPYGNGVAVYDPDTDRFVDFYEYTGDGNGPAGNTVLDLAYTDGEMWAATSYHIGPDQRRHGGGLSATDGLDWFSWGGGDDGFQTYHGSGDPADTDPYITGDVRSVGVAGNGAVWAGTWDLQGAALEYTWPNVDAVVDEQVGPQWLSHVFEGSGWVTALEEDAHGRMWAATSRGHAVQEADLTTMRRADTARGGIRVRNGDDWDDVRPETSGLAGRGITSLALDPRTGDMWVGTENGGIARYDGDAQPMPTHTPCADCPTKTPPPQPSPTGPLALTVAPERRPTSVYGASAVPPGPTAPPEPQPPPEVPEPATWLLLGGGLAALGAYGYWRRRRGEAEVR